MASQVRDLLANHGIGFETLDRIGVTTGPGAFTGLRVGLSFARGLALARNRPCIGLSTLAVLAAGAQSQKCVSAIYVAGSFFAAAYDGRRVVVPPTRTSPEALLDRLSGDWTVTGPGAGHILALAPDWVHVAADAPDPRILAQLAQWADPADNPPHPLYLRDADAKLPGPSRAIGQFRAEAASSPP